MTDHELPSRARVFLKRFLLLFYGPIAFLFVALAPVFCARRKGFRGWYWRVARRLIKVLLSALSIRVEIDEESRARLANASGSIIVANHKSHLDGLALISVTPDSRHLTFGAKVELMKVPFFRRGFSAAGILTVDRSAGKSALQSLIGEYRKTDSGVSLVLFPEGTRVNEKVLGKFKAGAVVIAQTLGKKIQPVCILGTMHLMPRYKMIPRAGTIQVRVLDDVTIPQEIPVGDQLVKLQAYMSDRYSEFEENLCATT